MTPEQLLLAVLGPVAVAGGIATVALAWIVHRDPGQPVTPEWAPGELDAVPELPLQPGGLHRAEGRLASDLIASSVGYRPRHGFEEVPPSIAPALVWMTPAERARELVRQLGQSGWWPFGNVVDRRLRITQRAWAIAHRHGIRPLLGTFQLQGVLPS